MFAIVHKDGGVIAKFGNKTESEINERVGEFDDIEWTDDADYVTSVDVDVDEWFDQSRDIVTRQIIQNRTETNQA